MLLSVAAVLYALVLIGVTWEIVRQHGWARFVVTSFQTDSCLAESGLGLLALFAIMGAWNLWREVFGKRSCMPAWYLRLFAIFYLTVLIWMLCYKFGFLLVLSILAETILVIFALLHVVRKRRRGWPRGRQL